MPASSAVRLYIFSEARNSGLKLLRSFGLLRLAVARLDKPAFVRAMGCGRGVGFSMFPDFGRYAIMVAGEESDLDAFEIRPEMAGMAAEACSLEVYDLLPLQGHGAWDGDTPFQRGEKPSPTAPLAVLTRARVPVRAIPAFIRHSQRVTGELAGAPGRIFSIGMGELPFVRQATFSVWTSEESMLKFAYGSSLHREAVGATRKKHLFGEELFWRFAVRGYAKRALRPG